MPQAPVPEWVDRHLGGPNLAVMGTVRADGAPSTVPCWYRYSDGRLHLSMGRDAARLKNLGRDPRASFSIIISTQPYAHAWLSGRAVDIRPDDDLANVDELSQIYLGEPFPDRTITPVAVIVEIDRWSTYGLSEREGDTR